MFWRKKKHLATHNFDWKRGASCQGIQMVGGPLEPHLLKHNKTLSLSLYENVFKCDVL